VLPFAWPVIRAGPARRAGKRGCGEAAQLVSRESNGLAIGVYRPPATGALVEALSMYLPWLTVGSIEVERLPVVGDLALPIAKGSGPKLARLELRPRSGHHRTTRDERSKKATRRSAITPVSGFGALRRRAKHIERVPGRAYHNPTVLSVPATPDNRSRRLSFSYPRADKRDRQTKREPTKNTPHRNPEDYALRAGSFATATSARTEHRCWPAHPIGHRSLVGIAAQASHLRRAFADAPYSHRGFPELRGLVLEPAQRAMSEPGRAS
jgi:hypothetical protein